MVEGLHNEVVNDILEKIIVYCNNKGTVDIAKNPVFHPQTKRFGIQHHIVRKKMCAGEMIILKIAGEQMITNYLTS